MSGLCWRARAFGDLIKTFNLGRFSLKRDLALAVDFPWHRLCGFPPSFPSSGIPQRAEMPPTEEDIAWLRSSFHAVPRPQLPDDCVEYSIYLISQELDSTNDSEKRLRLRDVQKAAADLQRKWLKNYIWQRQSFGLELVREDGEVCHAQGLWQPTKS